MDELDLLTRHRPEPAPPTAAERTAARDGLMAHIAGTGDGAGATDRAGATADRPVIDLASSPRRNRRTVRRAVALVGAAAAVVTGLLVAGASDRAPEPLRDRPATAAEQLEAIADSVTPYPGLPYTVPVQVTSTASGEGEPRSETSEAVVHRTSVDVWVTETPGCSSPCDAAFTDGLEPLPFPSDADGAAVRAAVDAEVRERLGPATPEGPGPDTVAQFRVHLVGSLLQHPSAAPAARAELMRVLAEVPGLTATPDATSALGAVGTEFRLVGEEGAETAVLLDPVDGFVLELRRASRTDDPALLPSEATGPAEGPPASEPTGSEEPSSYRFEEVTSFGRPTADPLPDAVADVAAAVAEAGPTVDLGDSTGPVCAVSEGPIPAADDLLGVAVPEGISYTYCPTS